MLWSLLSGQMQIQNSIICSVVLWLELCKSYFSFASRLLVRVCKCAHQETGRQEREGTFFFLFPCCTCQCHLSNSTLHSQTQPHFSIPSAARICFLSEARTPLARTPVNVQILKTPLPACFSHPQAWEPGPAVGISSLPQSGVSSFFFHPPTTLYSIFYLQFALLNYIISFLFS